MPPYWLHWGFHVVEEMGPQLFPVHRHSVSGGPSFAASRDSADGKRFPTLALLGSWAGLFVGASSVSAGDPVAVNAGTMFGTALAVLESRGLRGSWCVWLVVPL